MKTRSGNKLNIEYKGYWALKMICKFNSQQLYMQGPPTPANPNCFSKEITYLHEI